jgi:cytochrome b561
MSQPLAGNLRPSGYTATAKVLHWLMAALVLVMLPVGFTMIRVDPGTLQNTLFIIHKGTGATLILLIALRIAWRLTHPPPPLTGLPAWQARAAHLNHLLLYVMLVVMVTSGYVRTVAGGFPIELLGALGIPPLMGKNKAVEDIALAVHQTGMLVIAALVALHIGAALYHLRIRRDHVFWRMWPGRG